MMSHMIPDDAEGSVNFDSDFDWNTFDVPEEHHNHHNHNNYEGK